MNDLCVWCPRYMVCTQLMNEKTPAETVIKEINNNNNNNKATPVVPYSLDQAIKTNCYHCNILNDGTDPMCRICGQYQETIDHIVAGCPELTKTEYLHRHDKAASYVHRNIIMQRAKHKRRREMVWAWTPNTNRKRQHHNLVGCANTDRPWDKSQHTRHCNRTNRRKAAYSLICPSLLKRTLQLKLLKAVKIQRPWNRDWANVGDEGYNDPSCDWSAGTNKKGLGELHQTNPG